MSDSAPVSLIVVGDLRVPPWPGEGEPIQVAALSDALVAAAEASCPLLLADEATLEAVPATADVLKLLACDAPPSTIPVGVLGAVPLWDAPAAALALEASVQARTQLLEARGAAQASEAEREAFVHAVSHDLKGPLQGIIGLAGLLMEQSGVRVFPEVASFAQRIETDADRLAGMVSALTQYARLGRPRPTLEAVGLGPVVDAVCAAAIHRHTDRYPRFQVADEAPEVWGDPDLLTTALTALVDNAIAFSESDRPSVAIDWRVGAAVTVTVRDQGIGLPLHTLESVFEMFTRLDKRRGDGLGVGLPMARRAAELLSGSLSLTSVQGEGTTAHLTLPLPPTR